LNRTDKSAVIERLRDALMDVPSVVVVDFQGLTVSEVDVLRGEMRKAGVVYEVVKNTLIRQALADTPKSNMGSLFKGNTAVAYHAEEPGTPAKVVREFAKDHEKMTIKGGWLDGAVLNQAGVMTLADLPSKDELRAQLLSVLKGVPTKFVQTLAAAPTQFVQLLKAYQDKLEAA